MHIYTYPCISIYIGAEPYTHAHTLSLWFPLPLRQRFHFLHFHFHFHCSCASCSDEMYPGAAQIHCLPLHWSIGGRETCNCGRIPIIFSGCSWPFWQVSDRQQKAHSKVSGHWQALVNDCYKGCRINPQQLPKSLQQQALLEWKKQRQEAHCCHSCWEANRSLRTKSNWKTLRQS